MALDISIDDQTSADAPALRTFDEFCAAHADTVARALLLACGDDWLGATALGAAALEATLVRASQQWKQLRSHPNLMGWVFFAGVDHIDEILRESAPTSVNQATGGYVRGLPLDQAIAVLPVQQRAALVAAHYLGWSDPKAAAGSGSRLAAVTTRRTRGITFLAHHLRISPEQAAEQVVDHFRTAAEKLDPLVPVTTDLRRIGRRRTIRNRMGAGLAVLAVIVAGAALVQVGRHVSDPVAVGPEPISPPGSSSDWLGPVADGSGGFVALNNAGASRIAKSDDGVTWFQHSTWNSRAIDLRAVVTSFTRSGGRYIATLEAAGSIRTAVPPRVATSTDLINWQVIQVDVAPPADVDGLISKIEVGGVAAAGSKIVVGIRVTEDVDYRSLGISRQDVCVEATFDIARELHLCDGEVVTIDRPTDPFRTERTQFFLSEDGREFEPVRLPPGSDPSRLVGYGDGFAVANMAGGRISVSKDGRSWAPESVLVGGNRYNLIQGDPRGQALAVLPRIGGWQSGVFEGGVTEMSDIGIDIDPAVVWNKPDLVAGPAGWALFVTTSRPWERGDVTPGWAVDTGSWVVSRLPDSDTVTAQHQQRSTTYWFNEASDLLDIANDGAVTISFPNSDSPDQDEPIEITRADIDGSRVSDDESGRVKAQVFFSSDGRSWRSIWETTEDTWFGSVAVGDNEVLVSGTTLTGAAISVPLQ